MKMIIKRIVQHDKWNKIILNKYDWYQLEVNSGEELADMLEDPPTIKETTTITPATPSTPCAPTQSMPEKKSKQKRSCVLS